MVTAGKQPGSVVATDAIVRLDRTTSTPFYRQIESSLRESIVEGHLRSGTRLPSSRALAAALGVARNTVATVYDALVAEGLLETVVGGGTFVAADIPGRLMAVAERTKQQLAQSPPRVSARGSAASRVSSTFVDQSGPPAAFRPGVPDLAAFPDRIWRRCALDAWRQRERTRSLLQYGEPAGSLALRVALAGHLAATRGVRCDPDQVIVTSGSQQALGIALTITTDSHDEVWMEDPCRAAVQSVAAAHDVTAVSVEVDEHGFVVGDGVLRAPRARAAIVSPTYQYPLGITTSLERRMELIEWASRAQSWIIEDDYDSDFWYDGARVPAIQGLDRSDRVLYVGTFSRVLFPGVRIGFLVVPPPLVSVAWSVKAALDRHANLWVQDTVRAFINEGHLRRHIARMTRLYRQRQRQFVSTAQSMATDVMTVTAGRAGMHVVAWLHDMDDVWASETAARAGIQTVALSRYSHNRVLPPALLLGYAVAPDEAVGPALYRLASAIRRP